MMIRIPTRNTKAIYFSASCWLWVIAGAVLRGNVTSNGAEFNRPGVPGWNDFDRGFAD
jgi:hypothetical protein